MFMSHPGLATCLWKTVRESNKKLSTLVVFPSPVLTLISQYRNAWMCFHGKLADLTSEGFLKGAQGFLSQARQKGHVRFLCFTWCKKRLKKNFSLQTAMSSWASSRVAVSALTSDSLLSPVSSQAASHRSPLLSSVTTVSHQQLQ